MPTVRARAPHMKGALLDKVPTAGVRKNGEEHFLNESEWGTVRL